MFRIYTYIFHIYKTNKISILLGLMSSVHQWFGRPGFNPRSSQIKDPPKRYLMLPCLILSIIRYGSRVKWNNPGNRVESSHTPECSSF